MKMHGTLFMRKARGRVRTFMMAGCVDNAKLPDYVRVNSIQEQRNLVFGFHTGGDEYNEFMLIYYSKPQEIQS